MVTHLSDTLTHFPNFIAEYQNSTNSALYDVIDRVGSSNITSQATFRLYRGTELIYETKSGQLPFFGQHTYIYEISIPGYLPNYYSGSLMQLIAPTITATQTLVFQVGPDDAYYADTKTPYIVLILGLMFAVLFGYWCIWMGDGRHHKAESIAYTIYATFSFMSTIYFLTK